MATSRNSMRIRTVSPATEREIDRKTERVKDQHYEYERMTLEEKKDNLVEIEYPDDPYWLHSMLHSFMVSAFVWYFEFPVQNKEPTSSIWILESLIVKQTSSPTGTLTINMLKITCNTKCCSVFDCKSHLFSIIVVFDSITFPWNQYPFYNFFSPKFLSSRKNPKTNSE